MRIEPSWFVDERSIELIETWLFHRPNAAQAFSGSLGDQPAIWVQSKIVLDGILETRIL
jgi:hypothetical protein